MPDNSIQTNKMGRPTKINDELIAKAWEWVNSHDISVGSLLPTIEGLALELQTSRDTLYQWAKDNKDFSDILTELRSLQAQKLIQNSLVGRYNPTIAKLLLSKHGYVEKTEVDNKHEIVKPILGGATKDVIKGEVDDE